MNSSRPIMVLRAARASEDGYVWFASVKTFPRYSVAVERVPAADVIAYARRGATSTAPKRGKTRPMGLVGYLDALRLHFGGTLWLLDDAEERDLLISEVKEQRENNERKLAMARQEIR
jgi:hypothetical protein